MTGCIFQLLFWLGGAVNTAEENEDQQTKLIE